MLAIPERGFAPSANQHHVRLDALCDWLEGGVLFQPESKISAADVVDVLVEGNVYDTQESAWNRLEETWSELHDRKNLLGDGYPVEIASNHLLRKNNRTWTSVPGHSFCLALSFAELYPSWASSFGHDYTEQGELFEILTEESLKTSFRDWEVYRTGWSRTNTNKLRAVVNDVATWLGEPETRNFQRWSRPTANEAGLDLLFFRPMPDRRPGIPIYMVQCATGRPSNSNWLHKRKTPDIGLWSKLIDFAVLPRRAFATPFSFQESDFRRHCLAVEGIFLDRYRILAPTRTSDTWPPGPIAQRLISWMLPRICKLPSADEM